MKSGNQQRREAMNQKKTSQELGLTNETIFKSEVAMPY